MKDSTEKKKDITIKERQNKNETRIRKINYIKSIGILLLLVVSCQPLARINRQDRFKDPGSYETTSQRWFVNMVTY